MTTATKTKVKNDTVTCHHYWICPTPDGPTSVCTCKYCGDTQEMSNHITGPQISVATNKLRRDHEYFEGEWNWH
jgi:hypothetical protein